MSAALPVKRAGPMVASLLRPLRTANVRHAGPRLWHAQARASTTRSYGVVSEPLLPPKAGPVPPRPQLSLPEQAYKPEYYEALSTIMHLRERYIEDRVIFVPGDEMARLLKQLGARDEDFAALQTVSSNLVGDPTLLYRKTRSGRFYLDFDAGTLSRLEFQPFILSLAEDFKRHDSDTIRMFDEVEDELQLNSVFQALMVFKAAIYHGVPSHRRPNMDYDTNKWICTLFSVRTTTTPERLGEPALEGVHTDGVDHTMTTFLGSQNMQPESAVTFVHDMKESTGIRYTEASPKYIKGRAHHRNFLDTMVVVDSERKHSLSPVHALDPTRSATRDMLVFFSRKPTTKGHVSAGVDSLVPHKEMPMEIPIFLPLK